MPLPRKTTLAGLAPVLAALLLAACGGSDTSSSPPPLLLPDPPAGVGHADYAAMAATTAVPAYVDTGATNQRGDPCLATTAANAGVRVLAGMLDLWTPATLVVDAGYTSTIAAANGCPAIPPATWSGVPGDATDGHAVNAAVLDANVAYVVSVTATRSAAQAAAAYYDDRRGKGYSVTDGLGPLAETWRAAAQQTTSITAVPADATTVKYDDSGNNTGKDTAAGNAAFGAVVKLVNDASKDASTEPAKRFYKYARPWRWAPQVVVVPELVPAKSSTASNDGGFPSGHTAEAFRDALAMAYVLPERYQELVGRALELGENRILAGMHSPLDVMGGRILGEATVAYGLAAMTGATRKAAYDQAHVALRTAVGAADDLALFDAAHAATAAGADRFADAAASRREHARRMTYGFRQLGDTTRPAVVPKGAELLLETRLPYLTAEQRRVVLKTTAYPSGYPLMDEPEGWGRLDLFAAADGYAAFDGDVCVTMDAALGGFNARDAWRNDISGAGKLTKRGSGTLRLTGQNAYRGGTEVEEGALEARSASAVGRGDVYVAGGTLEVATTDDALHVDGKLTVRPAGTVRLVVDRTLSGRLLVTNTVTLDGGTLSVGFARGYRPAVGDVLNLVSADAVQGAFATVTVDGFAKVTPIYTAAGIQVRIDG